MARIFDSRRDLSVIFSMAWMRRRQRPDEMVHSVMTLGNARGALPAPSTDRSTFRWTRPLLALAILVHGYLCWHWRNNLSFDARFTYLPFARRLLSEGWTFLVDEKSVWVPFGAYGYPALFGANIHAIEMANLILSGSIVLMLYRIATQAHSMRAGLVVAWLYAVSPSITPFVINVLTEPPFLFFCTVWLWAFSELYASDARRWTWIGGLALGCAVNVRASLVLFIYGSFILAVVMSGRHIAARDTWQKLAGVQGIAVAVATLVILKNWLLFGLPQIALGSGNGFYLGNHTLTGGYDPDLVGLFFDVDAVAGDDHRTVNADRMLFSVGWEMLQAQPLGLTFANYWRKAWAFLFYPNVFLSDSMLTLRSLRICLIASAAVAMIRGWRAPVLLLAVCVAAYQLIVHTPVLYTPRYSEGALDLWLIVLGGCGFATVSQWSLRNVLWFVLALVAACYVGKTIRHLEYPIAPLHFNASVPHRILWEQREFVDVAPVDLAADSAIALHPSVQVALPAVEEITGNATIWQRPLFLILDISTPPNGNRCYKGRIDFRPRPTTAGNPGPEMYYPFRLERNSATQTFSFGISTPTATWQDGINGPGTFKIAFTCEPGSLLRLERLAIAEANYAAVYGATKSRTPTSTVSITEYYNAMLDVYFMAWVTDEVATLDAATNWTRTGQSLKAYATRQPGTLSMCRFVGFGNSQFFGLGTVECEAIRQKDQRFILESSNFAVYMFPHAHGICPVNTTEVYRVFKNSGEANYRYVTDKAIRDQMVVKGWVVEGEGPDGVVMCAPK